MRSLREEDGQVLVLAVLCMAVILGFVALAIDVGQLLLTKRQLQTAADAAALAGALEIQKCSSTANCTAMQNAATSALAENGLKNPTLVMQCASNRGTGLTLTLNNGPCALGYSDPNSGDTSYVEAVVTKQQPMLFAKVLGIKPMTISARSEAGTANSSFCIYISADSKYWGTSTGTTWYMNSGAHLTSACGVVNDSGASSSIWFNHGSHTSATEIYAHGGYSSNNGSHFSPDPTTGTLPIPDPLSWVPKPTAGGCTSVGPFSGKSNTLEPGTYCGFNINSGGSVTLDPGSTGLYIFTGPVNVGDGGTLVANGDTLYFSSGSLQPNSGSEVDVIAPTSGPYTGIALVEGPGNTTQMTVDSGAKITLQGAVYLPDAQLTLNSGGDLGAYTILDVQSLIVNSGAKLTVGNDYSSLHGKSPARVTKLME